MRILPIGSHLMQREALVDHKIGGIQIKKGMGVMVNIISHHYDESVFEDPFQFKPERWEKLENLSSISQ